MVERGAPRLSGTLSAKNRRRKHRGRAGTPGSPPHSPSPIMSAYETRREDCRTETARSVGRGRRRSTETREAALRRQDVCPRERRLYDNREHLSETCQAPTAPL